MTGNRRPIGYARRVSRLALLGLLALAGTGILATPRTSTANVPLVSSLTSSPVTIYGAKWCSACRSLENGLKERKVAFEVVDVDENPSAFARARNAAGAGGAIPLTSIVRTSGTVWIVGADVDGVDRAQRGE
jgi:mycoredoxin